MQHLNSNDLEEGVEYEIQTKDLLYLRTEDTDVASPQTLLFMGYVVIPL